VDRMGTSGEFRTVKQGSSSITDFCRRLETMAASLREFGDPVGDRTLVLTLLRGLSEKFRPMVTNIKLRQSFPSFSEARTLLLLEEIDLNDFAGDASTSSSSTTPTAGAPALLAATGSTNTAWRPLLAALLLLVTTRVARPPAKATRAGSSSRRRTGSTSARRRSTSPGRTEHRHRPLRGQCTDRLLQGTWPCSSSSRRRTATRPL
jgi:hypothetical protein